MFSPLRNGAGKRLREPFGKAGLTVAVIALVFAMLGGAYAANSDGGKATASAKAKKGPPGPRGKTGPAGPAGPAGSAGAKGDKGDTGAKGDTGSAGAPGTSVTAEEFGTIGKDGKCVGTGGSKFVAGATKTYACNGKDGEDGETGFTETLPEGETETGVWNGSQNAAGGAFVPVSFPIPLAAVPTQELTSSTTANCPGIVNGRPTAEPGFLCFYKGVGPGPEAGTSIANLIGSAERYGSVVSMFCTELCTWKGAWAVTAP